MEAEIALDGVNPKAVWFVSDPHFDHKNIIKYCYRPFDDVEIMNKVILRNWNDTIAVNDLVFFLGDMAFGRNSRQPKWWLKELNGNIYYFKGSHDDGIYPGCNEDLSIRVLRVLDLATVTFQNIVFGLVHDPANWPAKACTWLIHGHHHSNHPVDYPLINYAKHRINLSMELTGYMPVSLSKLLEWVEVK